MKPRIRASASLLALFSAMWAIAQDGDLLTSSPGGRGYFETVPLSIGTPAVAPFNLNVGTAIHSLATLNVRGDELPVNDAFGTSLCTFRTDVLSGNDQNWSMVRGTWSVENYTVPRSNNSREPEHSLLA